jgi:putative ABC transport system permease protein
MRDVRHAGNVSAPLFCGVVLAVLGVLIPARSAARLTIATVLHNE